MHQSESICDDSNTHNFYFFFEIKNQCKETQVANHISVLTKYSVKQIKALNVDQFSK